MLVYRVENPNNSSKSGEALSTSDLERLRSFITSPPTTGCTTVGQVKNIVQRSKIEFPNSVSGKLLFTSDLSRVE
jgi:hypothetical protein